jgi:hypothetical protein
LNKVEFLLLFANKNEEIILSKEAMINENTDNYVTIDINKENSSCRINKVTDIKFGIIEIY